MYEEIEFINETAPTVSYEVQAMAEYEAGEGDGIDKYTTQFETDYAEALKGCKGEDIGGLIVYVIDEKVRAVYDYENFCGWVV
jgi:hypothetical protein